MRVSAPNLRAALAYLRQAGMASIARRRAIATFGELLVPAGLVVEILVGKHRVARIGAGVRGGPLSNLVGLPSVELRPLGILKAALAR